MNDAQKADAVMDAFVDSDLISFLEQIHADSGYTLCVLRKSTTGRGWRLHSASERELDNYGYKGDLTVRAAIARAMRDGLQ